MGKISYAFTPHDSLLSYCESLDQSLIHKAQDIDCLAEFVPEHAALKWSSPYDELYPNRPYMAIEGKITSIKFEPNTAIPSDIDKLAFEEDKGIDVCFVYDFSDDELADMVKKGLFRKGFKCPKIMTERVMTDMPVKCDFVSVQAPSVAPIIFASVQNEKGIEIVSQTCGYVFGEYFENVEKKVDERNENVRRILSLDSRTMPEPVKETKPEPQPETKADIEDEPEPAHDDYAPIGPVDTDQIMAQILRGGDGDADLSAFAGSSNSDEPLVESETETMEVY